MTLTKKVTPTEVGQKNLAIIVQKIILNLKIQINIQLIGLNLKSKKLELDMKIDSLIKVDQIGLDMD